MKAIYSCLLKQIDDFSDSDFDSQRQTLENMVERLCKKKEGNSVLLIGQNGVGKRRLLQQVLSQIDKRSAALILLNGLIQTDDKIALKEIGRQLSINLDVDEPGFSYAECLSNLLNNLQSDKSKARAFIFVLEEMDLFAAHHNQSLLYNLLDATQSSQCVPSLVIGVASYDVTELLEKRVRSRLSGRQLMFVNTWSLDTYLEQAAQLLMVDEHKMLAMSAAQRKEANKWNGCIENLMEQETVQRIIGNQYRMKRSPEDLITFLQLVLFQGQATAGLIEAKHFEIVQKLRSPRATEMSLKGLSLLELCVLIAAQRVSERFNRDPFNFEIIYEEFRRFVNHYKVKLFDFDDKSELGQHTSRIMDKIIVSKAFERLSSLELVTPISDISKHQQSSFKLYQIQVDPVLLSSVVNDPETHCTAPVKTWLSSKILQG